MIWDNNYCYLLRGVMPRHTVPKMPFVLVFCSTKILENIEKKRITPGARTRPIKESTIERAHLVMINWVLNHDGIHQNDLSAHKFSIENNEIFFLMKKIKKNKKWVNYVGFLFEKCD